MRDWCVDSWADDLGVGSSVQLLRIWFGGVGLRLGNFGESEKCWLGVFSGDLESSWGKMY